VKPDFSRSGASFVGSIFLVPACHNFQRAIRWTVGAGAEMKFTDNISGRLEYRYTDLGSIDVSGVSGAQEEFTGDTSTDVVVQSVRATVNFRF
jgi:opacity protein-like surface antigen